MRQFLTSSEAMIIGVVACSLVLPIAAYLLLAPGPVSISQERRRPGAVRPAGVLAGAAATVTNLTDKLLRRRGNLDAHVAVLERAGVKMGLQEVAVLVMVGSVVAAAVGMLLVGPVGLALALAVPLLTRVVLNMMASRRQSTFADQLDDSLQLIASSLRAGHSLLQALAAVSREAEQPTCDEFARIINETRVGRQLSQALDETAARMNSEDFVWVTQAIAINREVGGNLAEVLDGVGRTIRERNQIRRQVKALSAEGKLSAYVLMALPVGIAAFLGRSNPAYMGRFVESAAGYAMIGAAVVLFIVGSLWLRKVVSFKF